MGPGGSLTGISNELSFEGRAFSAGKTGSYLNLTPLPPLKSPCHLQSIS